MKKILIVLLALSILAFAGVVIAGPNNDPGISGTPHDIQVWQSKTGTEPCAFCHTPHVPGGSEPTYPLWNRSQPTQTYTMYTSATFDMKGNSATMKDYDVDASTRACMQCHNGQAATLVNYPGRGVSSSASYETMSWEPTGLGNLGLDLKQEHPVAFDYEPADDSIANGGQNNGFPPMISGKVENKNLPFYNKTVKATGTTGMMGCGTCHEPHDTYSYSGKSSQGEAGSQVFFLRNADSDADGNVGSAMCKACHVNRY